MGQVPNGALIISLSWLKLVSSRLEKTKAAYYHLVAASPSNESQMNFLLGRLTCVRRMSKPGGSRQRITSFIHGASAHPCCWCFEMHFSTAASSLRGEQCLYPLSTADRPRCGSDGPLMISAGLKDRRLQPPLPQRIASASASVPWSCGSDQQMGR